MSIKPLVLTIPSILACAGLPAYVLAQAASEAAAPPAEKAVIELKDESASERKWTFEVHASGTHTFRADIDDSPGDVDISRALLGLSVAIPIGDRSHLSIGIEEEASWYLFHDATGLVPGSSDPFELVLSTDLTARFFSSIDEHWSWFVGGLVNFSGEPDVDVGDAATFGGFGGARYQFNENFALSFGLGAKSRLEDDALVIPFIGVDWKITDRVSLSTEGTKVRLAAKINEQLGVSLTGGWERREYRLRDDGPLPDGVVRDARIPIGVSLDWKPTSNIEVSIFGGAVVWQEFQFDDLSGDEITETNTDPAPFIGISGKITF